MTNETTSCINECAVGKENECESKYRNIIMTKSHSIIEYYLVETSILPAMNVEYEWKMPKNRRWDKSVVDSYVAARLMFVSVVPFRRQHNDHN